MVNALSGSTLPLAAVNSVIVVGGGLAGLRTGQSLRSLGFTGKIVLVSQEAHAPYDRPPLSKHIMENDAPVDLATDLSADFESIFDEFFRLHRAVALSESTEGVTVTLEPVEGAQLSQTPGPSRASFEISADVAVLALGAQPVAPTHWVGTQSLYTWEDSVHLREHLRLPSAGSESTADVLIIGSGWVGTEIAGIAQGQGLRVSVVEAKPTPLFKQVGPQVGARVAKWFAHCGVELLTNSLVTSVDSRSQSIVVVGTSESDHQSTRRLSQSWIREARMVLSAVGVRPSTSWVPSLYARSPLGAFITNEWGQIRYEEQSDASAGDLFSTRVFSVGDSAQRIDPVHGHVPGGHWNIALTDPERLAQAITSPGGQSATSLPTPTPYVFSTLFGHDIALFGLPSATTDEVIFRDYADGSWTALYLDRDAAQFGAVRVTGIFTCDAPRDAASARKLLKHGPLKVSNSELLSQSDVPLKKVLA